jgi:serine/threonine protein kinase
MTMSDLSERDEDTLPPWEVRRIDQVCDDFEKAWIAGSPVPIEKALGDTAGRVRAVLLAELLRLELHYRRTLGEAPTGEEYLRKFPEQADLLRRMLGFTAPVPPPAEQADVSPLPRGEVAEATASPTPTKAPPPKQLLPRERWPKIPGYEIVDHIDGGGQGHVFKARHVALDRLVALKTLHDTGEGEKERLARFRREGKLSARLDHPNIVRVYDFDAHEGKLYFTMEFVEGGNLKQRLEREHRLPPGAAAALLLELALTIQHAHDLEIIHRDLKPENILFTAGGSPKITDFGLAKWLADGATELTRKNTVMGSAPYMSPEAAAGKTSQIGKATDIYGLGAIFYETLTGQPPFVGQSWLEILDKVRFQRLVPPSVLRPEVPRPLERVCLKCLEKEPTSRYSSAANLASDLHRFLSREESDEDSSGRTVGPPSSPENLVPPPSSVDTVYPPRQEAEVWTPPAAVEDDPGGGFPVVPGYKILAQLGRGGMGVVYKALQLKLKRVVALKTVHQATGGGERWRRLLRMEGELAAALNHPNIVQIFDLAEHAGLVYIAMEFVEGGSLTQILGDKGPQHPRSAADLVEQLARAAAFFHGRGIVHRDLKPSNVLLDMSTRGGTNSLRNQGARVEARYGIPKITDFGLARRFQHPMDEALGVAWNQDGPQASSEFDESELTHEGQIVGTPAYMSPEQACGRLLQVGPPSDVWSLGVIFYEMLTGSRPFAGVSSSALMEQILTGQVRPPRSLQAGLPPILEAICLKCLRKEPHERYSTGQELADDLRRFLEGRRTSVAAPSFWKRLFGYRA